MESLTSVLQGLLGIVAFIAIAWLLSEDRRVPEWRLVVGALGLQFLIAVVMFHVSFMQAGLSELNDAVSALVNALGAGTGFVFGYLGNDPGQVAFPFAVTDAGATYILAFRVLPLIMFFTVLSAILWHYKILPYVIRGFSWLLRRSLGVGGAVGVSTAGNIFLGMVESPLLIRPYIPRLTRSELFIVMTCGMATVAGSVMVLYAVILKSVLVNAMGQILTASVISAPAAILIAKVMVPGDRTTGDDESVIEPIHYHSLMDAISRGTTDGLKLMVNVGAMLVVLVALVALVNSILSLLPHMGGTPITMQRLFGYVFAPIVWLMGVPWHESMTAGALMGTKTVLNELLAYLAMAKLPPHSLSPRSTVIMTYAICGFANFGSLGIMIGGITGMCPERRSEILELAPRTLISGTLATCMTGAVAGLLY